MKPMLAVLLFGSLAAAQDPWITYQGHDGPGKGRHVVLVSGDEEYRSEEALPQLGRILAAHHGFTCTVLFAIDPADGTINPVVTTNIPGLETLAKANLMIIATRFRNLPDDQMKHVVDYVESGRPIIGMRTATHAFKIPKESKYARYSFDSRMEGWEGGFGRRILGETWINHHGRHGQQSTRGVIAPGTKDHPIVRGCDDIWGPTDVYEVRLPLPGDSKTLVLGQVIENMQPDGKPVPGKPNDPMMPIAWIRTYPGEKPPAPGGPAAPAGNGRVFTTTMGSSVDLSSAGLRRLLVNAAYWCVGLQDRIRPDARVDLVGPYKPTPFGFGAHQKGLKPAALARPDLQPP